MPYTDDGNNRLASYQPDLTLNPEDYISYIGKEGVDSLKRLAEPLEGKSWANINSTLDGGGVAEILRGALPLARSLGVDARWCVMEGNDAFFQVTKKYHNLLQGIEQPISLEEIFNTYLDTIELNAQHTHISSDMIVVHDPQPLGLLTKGVLFGNILWRCHIDTSTPSQVVWRFILPYVNQCTGAIFTMPSFVGPGLQIPVYEISPCIDPRAVKNRQYAESEARDVLSVLFKESKVDPDRPILAAISRYDIHKNQSTILKAFQKLQAEKRYDPQPYLIFVGNTVADDPEGSDMLDQLRDEAGDDPNVRIWVNVEDNDRVIGALMRVARGFVHVSTREGFGLVVAEALWQGTPVIGSRVGGIVKQVIDGETGYLVDPLDVDTIASRMARLLDDPEEAEALGARAREHIRKNYLLPDLVRRYLMLLRYYTGVDREPPPFRMNGKAYSETIDMIRARHAGLDDLGITK
ncbi:MAG: glycosyltransferase [Candidatus Latescibacteria bacterium]|nr:glycosyltransferase [Candidatus Latescibacterota bacterium]NIM22693.1 glycosyltransferase [Candidatus Latescibacterota bacterium]NIM64982.1 glycosyltransferase [Candidatus Latescibacterota bacterium]NIO01497.1 glycosyltransferase [Candidatus Latescibacterota bacterium]NIO28007.1 glycosyltransferase [Candidatus Latescibacterota bacterium]